MNKLVLAFVLAAAAVPVRAGDLEGLVSEPGSPMHWTLEIRNDPAEGAASPGQLASISITRTGDLERVILETKNGGRKELWRKEGNTLYRYAGNRITVIGDSPETSPYPFASPGFFGMEKIKAADERVGGAVFEGVPCRHFFGKDYEAWFAAETGLPAAFRSGPTTLVFHFSPQSPSPLVLPPEFQAAWVLHEKNLQKAGLR